MAIPTSYLTSGFSKIPQYFESMLTAKAPEKFTMKFMEDLDFKSSNDRNFIGVLKALGFLDEAGIPTERYFKFLDQSLSKIMVADGIKEAYVDLFNLNVHAQKMQKSEVEGKFKTMTSGTKNSSTISYMASTFVNLCEYADWADPVKEVKQEKATEKQTLRVENTSTDETKNQSIRNFDLNYDIHIHLPATRDQSVYDALFASMTKHLNLK